MSEVVPNAQHEFWRPPTLEQIDAPPAMVEACDDCGTEFMVGSRFCHVCGTARQAQASPLVAQRWMHHLAFLHVLEFQNVKQGLGLGTASLIAFMAGLGCLLAALFVGAIYSVQTFADFQAIQLWRLQWLVGAVASFVAGILLKSAGTQKK